MPDETLPLRASEFALWVLGYEEAGEAEVRRGAWNWVVCYADLGLAVRVSPRHMSVDVEHGYRVGELVGPTVALGVRFTTSFAGCLVAVMDLAEPLGVTDEAWITAQTLGARVHTVDPAALGVHLGVFDPIHDLATHLGRMRDSVFAPWVEPLAERASAIQIALGSRVERPVLLHGDLHAGQVVRTNHGARLIDFDVAMHGDVEADWGRIVAWDRAGQLGSNCLERARVASGEELDERRLALYGEAYALRYVTALVHRVLDGANVHDTRLGAFARAYGLGDGVLSRSRD